MARGPDGACLWRAKSVLCPLKVVGYHTRGNTNGTSNLAQNGFEGMLDLYRLSLGVIDGQSLFLKFHVEACFHVRW